MDKKLIKYVGIVIGALLIIIVLLVIVNSFKGGKKYSYGQIEEKLIKAAKKYVDDKMDKNINILPDNPLADPYYLSSSILYNNGYIDDLTTMHKGDIACVGGVNIYNSDGKNYDYVPELTCGTESETKLVDKIIVDNDYGTVNGSGLYQRVNGKFITNSQDLSGGTSDDFEYVFRGDEVNNYIKIDDNLWRIVAIDENNNILVIFNSTVQKASVWDDKYNEDVKKNYGINTYEKNGLESEIFKVVRDFYDGNVKLFNKEKYSDKTKYLIVPMDLCIGKRSITDSDFSGKIECEEKLEEQNAGLLPAYYYMSASLDTSCDSILSKSCGNYNYLTDFNDSWWLLTGNSENSYEAYSVSKKTMLSNNCSYRSSVRPTIKIGSRVIYKEGDGSLENPYQIKFYD